MRNKLYINGIAGISAQAGGAVFSGKINEYQQNIFPAIDENYKEWIPPMMLRRMSKAVKMAIASARKSLADAGIEDPDAIITGTGQGCKLDTGKFLKSMLQQEEGLLTPTSF
ncbi:MAG: 3-oxoacyl-ACP synthase, partial [Salegentibacter sp.]